MCLMKDHAWKKFWYKNLGRILLHKSHIHLKIFISNIIKFIDIQCIYNEGCELP